MRILLPEGKEEEISADGRNLEAIIQSIGLNPVEVLISRDGEIIPEDTIGSDTDTIHLIRISHGG